MKKIILFLTAALFYTSCEENPPAPQPGYPTDNLVLAETKNALLIASYMPSTGYSFDILRATVQDLYPGQVNYFSAVGDQSSALYNGLTDSISLNQPLEPAPSLYLNDATLDPASVEESIERELNKKPIASVNHVISQNDTAWLIDSKIKFWKDSTGGTFYIETYLGSSMIAANYSSLGVNIQANAAAGFVRNVDSISVWEKDINNLDSSKVLFKKDKPFRHPMVLSASSNPDFAWGVSLCEYTPFCAAFSANDLIGTKFTPISQYILKPDSDIEGAYSPGFDFKPTFITVIWALNKETAKFEYINSVSTTL